MESIKIIKTLDNLLRFLYWEYPQVMLGGIGLCFGLLMRSVLCGVLGLIVTMLLYKKIKRVVPAYFRRFSYWQFFPKNTKRFLSSHKRNLIR